MAKKKEGKIKSKAKKLKEQLCCDCKVKPLALGLTFGFIGILYIVVLSIWASMVGGGSEWIRIIGDLYWGYAPTLKGTLLGAGWAFTDCFVLGIVIGYLYNWLAGLMQK